jgi:isopenicillin-N epimerase
VTAHEKRTLPKRDALASHWTLDPDVVFLNHGSFGATPRTVLDLQQQLRRRMEFEPVRFLVRELEPMLDLARADLASFVGADPEDLVFVPNATAGVNAVLRSLDLDRHDELITTSHEYNASKNALEFVASLSGAKFIVVDLPFPVRSEEELLAPLLAAVTERTRLLLIDHITSPTGIILPVDRVIAELNSRGIDTLVDGAHTAGMLPLDLQSLGAAYYTGNLHKWTCAPKGSAFLHVRKNRRSTIRPTSISHGANAERTDRSRFHLEFDWTGTFDPTGWLSVPESLRVVGGLIPGGWPAVRQRNHDLALRGRDILCQRLGICHPAPDAILGSMAAIPLPRGTSTAAYSLYGDPLQDILLEKYAIEVPVVPWPASPRRVLRISAQLYNAVEEYEYLADALVTELAAGN